MGGYNSLLSKESTLPYNKSSKINAPNCWPDFFPVRDNITIDAEDYPVYPDMNGYLTDGQRLTLPRNAGFAFAVNNTRVCIDSAICRSETIRKEDTQSEVQNVPAYTSDTTDVSLTNNGSLIATLTRKNIYKNVSPINNIHFTPSPDDLKYDIFGLVCGYSDHNLPNLIDHLLVEKIREKLSEVREYIVDCLNGDLEIVHIPDEPFAYCQTDEINFDDIIIGAIEQSFFEVDQAITRKYAQYSISGGCSVLICLYLYNKIFIANSGNCRAFIFSPFNECQQVTNDCTPEHDRQRLQTIAYLQPSLIRPSYTHLQFEYTIKPKDRGQKVLYRDKHMNGWAYKQITEEDIEKSPMITGVGDESKLFGIKIPVRGFGYYDMKAPGLVPLKAFITPIPEIEVISTKNYNSSDVLVLTSPDCSNLFTADGIGTILSKTFSNDWKFSPTSDSVRQIATYTAQSNINQICAFNIANLFLKSAQNTNMERQILCKDSEFVANSDAQNNSELSLQCMVIPLEMNETSYNSECKIQFQINNLP